MSPDIIPRRMASPGGAMSEGHGIMSPDIILRRMASPGGAMSEGHGIMSYQKQEGGDCI